MISIRAVFVVSLLVATVEAGMGGGGEPNVHPEHSIRWGKHDKRYGGRGLHGDIHLTGFQGQPYTVDTQSGSIYSLLSMPSLYMNARMTDMTTAEHCVAEAVTNSMPARSERECLSYPGTYMTSLGLVSGDDRITVDARPRGESLMVTLNGASFEWSRLTVAIANGTLELDENMMTLTLTTRDIRITIRNVDRYLNVHVDILRSEWLEAGQRQNIPKNAGSRYANDVAAASLPVVMHGLLGQSINYVIYNGGAVFQGDASDYSVKSLLSQQFAFSLYQPTGDVASVQYP